MPNRHPPAATRPNPGKSARLVTCRPPPFFASITSFVFPDVEASISEPKSVKTQDPRPKTPDARRKAKTKNKTSSVLMPSLVSAPAPIP